MSQNFDPIQMLRPRRKITGMSAILLPFTTDGEIDWPAFTAHVERTADVGLTPAVNMDTGYVNLISDEQKLAVLKRTRETLGKKSFVAGAFVGDRPGDRFNRDAYLRQIEAITSHGGVPVIFQSHGLTAQDDSALIASYAEFGRQCDKFIGFELGTMFAPFGKIYSLDAYAGLMNIKQCIGAKHSSLERELEWDRLRLRDKTRPDFHVFTGNDLAIDMVMYGSDYLLGLSTFAPDIFALRDRCWEKGDPAFYEINDALQYLGFLTFRRPVPAYKHSAAMFLKLRGWIACDHTHPLSPTRPESDRDILREIGRELGIIS
ncbi:MAG: dihydrodipicolinate synthase family protein [Planctomycetes bacterium]|nr:dihydrodipicolinate synthase family protein [Planctomycetota bacterium]